MSIASLHQQIDSVNRQIQSALQQVQQVETRMTSKRKEINSIEERMLREKDNKRTLSLKKEHQRKSDELLRLDKDKSNKQKNQQQHENKYNSLQLQLNKEQEKERKKIELHQNNVLATQQKITRELQNQQRWMDSRSGIQTLTMPAKKYDIFVSYAWEDKDFAGPLVEALTNQGLSVFYDSKELRIGMSLRRSLESAINNSRFGVIILSGNFFAKEWTQKELDAFFQLESGGQEIILPVWHNISKDEVKKHSVFLADKIALKSADLTVDEIAARIFDLFK